VKKNPIARSYIKSILLVYPYTKMRLDTSSEIVQLVITFKSNELASVVLLSKYPVRITIAIVANCEIKVIKAYYA